LCIKGIKGVSHGFDARLQDAFAAAQKSLEQRLDQYRFSYEALDGLGFGDDQWYTNGSGLVMVKVKVIDSSY